MQTDDVTPIYYALSKGMYQRVGLDIEMVAASSGTAATAAVVSGTYEVGKGSVIASLLAHIRNLPLVYVANGVVWDTKAPVSVAVVAADSNMKTASDLAGKIASAAALNDIVTLSINAWADKNGGDSSSLKWVEIPNSAEADALISHRVDICSLNEPQLTRRLRPARCASSRTAWTRSSNHPQDQSSARRDVLRSGAPPAGHRRRCQVQEHPAQLSSERDVLRRVNSRI